MKKSQMNSTFEWLMMQMNSWIKARLSYLEAAADSSQSMEFIYLKQILKYPRGILWN